MIVRIENVDADLCDSLWIDWHNGYAVRRVKGLRSQDKHEYLHLIIAKRMGLTGPTIDHKDRDPTNCQRSNLRNATRNQQIMNSIRAKSKSGYRGVNYVARLNKYRAYVRIDGTQVHLGHFICPIKAAKTFDRNAKYYYGDFAVLNFPENNEKSIADAIAQCSCTECRRSQAAGATSDNPGVGDTGVSDRPGSGDAAGSPIPEGAKVEGADGDNFASNVDIKV